MNSNFQTKDVSITTFSVTIKALHIDSKRMTLATFKQLPKSDLYDDYGNIVEDINVWGYVRYNIFDVVYWAVFDYEGELYRGDILLQSKNKSIRALINTEESYIDELKKRIKFNRSEIDRHKAGIAKHKEVYGENAYMDFSSRERQILDLTSVIDNCIDELPKSIKRLDVYRAMKKHSEEILNLQQLFIAI